MKKKLSAMSIIVILAVLLVTTVLAVKPGLIFIFKYNSKQTANSTKSDIKQNKLTKEEYDDKTKIIKSTKLEKVYGKSENDFKLIKEKMDTEDSSELFSYIAPTGLAIDNQGTLYIDDPANQEIKKIDASGNIIESISVKKVFDNSSNTEEWNYIIDWGVNKNGCIYILTHNGLFYSKDNSNTEFVKSKIAFDNPQRLYISSYGNINVLDINRETMNLRVQKISESDEFISAFEQYNEELNLFDYEDEYGNITKINLVGGSCDDELQYIMTNTAYPDKEFMVSFSKEKGDSIRGIHVIGFDNNQNMYFLKDISATNNGNSGEVVDCFVVVFSFSDNTMHIYNIGEKKPFKVQGLTKHNIIVDSNGAIYQLQTSEDEVNVSKYSIVQK